MGFLVQTTILFAVLYYVPFLGPVQDEAGIVGATVVAVLASALLSFVVDLVRAPVRIDGFQRDDLKSAYDLIEELNREETAIESLCILFRRGVDLYSTSSTKEFMQTRFDEWNAECENIILKHFSSSVLHEFRHTPPNAINRINIHSPLEYTHDIESGKIIQKFLGRLIAIDTIIRSQGINFIGLKEAMKSTLDRRKWEHYDLLLPQSGRRSGARSGPQPSARRCWR